ncbi:MAG: glycosyl hydrolase, partial [Tenericutes bacterium HGW-Tenericutes-6]
MKLTQEEKVQLLDGLDVWHTKPVKDLPSIMMADGPHGLRKQYESKDNLGVFGSVPATCFPTASLTACSFDPELLKTMGKYMAIEAKKEKVNIILGPGINMKRSPLCGRNFEYFSEDPYLAGELASAFVRGIEDEGVGTSVKHFFANNQEKNRFFIDSIVDERALREIYLKAFERVVKENPATVMASYNKINGFYATEHPYIQKVLRKEWGFKGVVVSDWGAVHKRVESLKAGCDLEMPTSFGYRSKEVLDHIKDDDVLRQSVTKSSERIIELARKYKTYDKVTYDIDAHHKVAKRIASESMVLLKNQDILPLSKKDKVLFLGGFIENMRFQGGGSSHINPTKVSQIKSLLPTYSEHAIDTTGYTLDQEKLDQDLLEEAVEKAKLVDKVVYVMGLPDRYETEGFDRDTLNIPSHQIELLEKLHEVNPNIIGVIIAGSVVSLSFESMTKGLLLAYLGGQASSEAILDILYGKINPSGRLAETFIDDIKDCNVQLTNDNNAVYYDESIFIGYRYYHTFNKKVRYPFGYGLSYTTFEYPSMVLDETKDGYHLSITVQNTGKVKGKEVIQVYIGNNESSVYKARRELKRFKKIELKPGESQTIDIDLLTSDFAYYDIYKKRFTIEKGDYQILVCKHVNDEIESFDVKLQGEEVHHPALSYQKYIYDPQEFSKICQRTLPPKNVIKKRPYTLSSTLEDAKNTLMGRIVRH